MDPLDDEVIDTLMKTISLLCLDVAAKRIRQDGDAALREMISDVEVALAEGKVSQVAADHLVSILNLASRVAAAQDH